MRKVKKKMIYKNRWACMHGRDMSIQPPSLPEHLFLFYFILFCHLLYLFVFSFLNRLFVIFSSHLTSSNNCKIGLKFLNLKNSDSNNFFI